MATRPSSPPHLLPVHRSLVDRGGASVAGMARRRPSGSSPLSYKKPSAAPTTLATFPFPLAPLPSSPSKAAAAAHQSHGHRQALADPRCPGGPSSSTTSPAPLDRGGGTTERLLRPALLRLGHRIILVLDQGHRSSPSPLPRPHAPPVSLCAGCALPCLL